MTPGYARLRLPEAVGAEDGLAHESQGVEHVALAGGVRAVERHGRQQRLAELWGTEQPRILRATEVGGDQGEHLLVAQTGTQSSERA